MSDVVPPGGDRPVDDIPWPSASAPAAPAAARLSAVPADAPGDVVAPADWRTLEDGGLLTPPGYRSATGRVAPGGPGGAGTQLDQFGIAACAVGVVALLQLAFFVVPLLAVLAVALGLSGRRYIRLDPGRFRLPVLSTIGVGLGAAGLVAGIALSLAEYA